MVMVAFSNLDKKDFAFEVVHNGLPATEVPPLDRVIELTAGDDDPIGQICAGNLLDRRRHSSFRFREVNVSF